MSELPVLSRRGFLGGLLTVAAVSAVPLAYKIRALPILYGDGVHDDFAALNAFFSNQPFQTLDGFSGIVEEGLISGGNFRSSKPLRPLVNDRLVTSGITLRYDFLPGEVIHCDSVVYQDGKTSHV